MRFVDLRGYRALLASADASGPSGDVPTLRVGAAVEHLRCLAMAAGSELRSAG